MKCMSTHNMCEVWQRLSASTTEELSWTIITDRQQWNAPRVFSAAFNWMPMQHISLAFSLACADRCPRNVSWMSSCLSGCVRRCLLCTRNQDWDEWKDLWDRQLQQRWLPPLPLWFETELLGVCVCRKEGGKITAYIMSAGYSSCYRVNQSCVSVSQPFISTHSSSHRGSVTGWKEMFVNRGRDKGSAAIILYMQSDSYILELQIFVLMIRHFGRSLNRILLNALLPWYLEKPGVKIFFSLSDSSISAFISVLS